MMFNLRRYWESISHANDMLIVDSLLAMLSENMPILASSTLCLSAPVPSLNYIIMTSKEIPERMEPWFCRFFPLDDMFLVLTLIGLWLEWRAKTELVGSMQGVYHHHHACANLFFTMIPSNLIFVEHGRKFQKEWNHDFVAFFLLSLNGIFHPSTHALLRGWEEKHVSLQSNLIENIQTQSKSYFLQPLCRAWCKAQVNKVSQSDQWPEILS
jgi:hypothetical protein